MLGATLPGCPLFAVARTPQLGWGVTYLKGDTSDYFIEDCRPGGSDRLAVSPRRGVARLSAAHEEIRRKRAPAETLRVYYNPQGTLETDPAGVGGRLLSVVHLDRQRRRRGRIDRHLARRDRLPAPPPTPWTSPASVRSRRCAGCSPIARDTSACKPTAGFPNAIRPTAACCRFRPGTRPITGAAGWRVTTCRASTIRPKVSSPRPTRTSTRRAGRCWSRMPVPDYRKRRIVERLAELPQATVTDMQQLQYDVVSLQARDLLPVFLPHLPDGPIKERLAEWDCSYHPGSFEATLFSQLYRNVLLEIFGEAPHAKGAASAGGGCCIFRRGSAFRRWCSPRSTGCSQQEALALVGRPRQGRVDPPRRRKTGRRARPAVGRSTRFTSPIASSTAAAMGRALGFHTREMPMPGCHATPFQGHLLRPPSAKRRSPRRITS